MDRKEATRAITKLLGTRWGFRVNASAPDEEERAFAAQGLATARASLKDTERMLRSRHDPCPFPFQLLLRKSHTQRERIAALETRVAQYKYTVVSTARSRHFDVLAEGDTWEQIVTQLTETAQAR
jgi:hypothetical protein